VQEPATIALSIPKKERCEAMAEQAEDPVCGMAVDPEQAAYKTEYRGKTYYFCSLRCKDQFESEPEGYVAS
jgi:YHS domain-containing protein